MKHKTEKGAQLFSKGTISSRFNMTMRQHRIECLKGIQDILKYPLSSFMTIAVLAIALALPTSFYIFLKNINTLSDNWDGVAQISLFLKTSADEKAIEKLQKKLQTSKKIAKIEFIDKEKGLKEFSERSGFGEALSYLDDNPLPHTFLVIPSKSFSTPIASQQLTEELQKESAVELAQLDLKWVQKFHSIMHIAERIVYILSILLSLAVLLIIGNTIRLAIQSRREEIQIIKLVGATDAFIRRPFLYSGIWYGLIAGLIAFLLISISVFWLSDPVNRLSAQYNSHFVLTGLSIADVVQLLAVSTLLGFLGSWLSVGRHLKDIEPT